jgi:hypothetical protein
MEKTIGFAIQEALESGRRSANPTYSELETREKLAQEIEKYHDFQYMHSEEPNSCPDGFCNCETLATLVRGHK